MKYYAGIGSRDTPPEVLHLMTRIAKWYDAEYILRSGGARGADSAFEKGAERKEVFRAEDAAEWAYEYVESYCMPSDRQGYPGWKPDIKGLLARNMMQVLGDDGKKPVRFVICYAPSLDYTDSSAGGTGYAIRCALKNSIPVYNLFDPEIYQQFGGNDAKS